MEFCKLFEKVKKLRNKFIDDLCKISTVISLSDAYENSNDLYYLVMALEDRRYLKHKGVDFISIMRELFKFFLCKKHGGASTIDMQMVRTITGFKEKTIYRKTYEIILSIVINRSYTKKQIIQCYLNNAFFGSGLYGSEAASYAIFNQEEASLDIAQKAIIAAMLLNPKPLKYNELWIAKVSARALYAHALLGTIKKKNKKFHL